MKATLACKGKLKIADIILNQKDPKRRGNGRREE